MSLKEKISLDQWKALYNAINAASTYVASASGGGLEMVKEAFTASKFMVETSAKSDGSGYGKLVDDILAAMKEMSFGDAKSDTEKYQSKDLTSLRTELKQNVAEGADVASTLEGGDGYKQWLLDMALKVAETKTGGVLGVGGKSVIDEKEQAALDELKAMLGV